MLVHPLANAGEEPKLKTAIAIATAAATLKRIEAPFSKDKDRFESAKKLAAQE